MGAKVRVVELHELERESEAFHDREAPEAVTLWNDGLNVLLAGMNAMNGHTNVLLEQAARGALVITAMHSLQCTYELALKGYYLQAANLLRTIFEYAIAAEYLRFRPEEVRYFLDEACQTPRLNSMVNTIGSMLRKSQGKKAQQEFLSTCRQLVKDLDPFSHVDKRGLLSVMRQTSEHFVIRAGPDQNLRAYIACAFKATWIIGLLVTVAVDLRQELGLSDFGEQATSYCQRWAKWSDERASDLTVPSPAGAAE